MNVRIGNDIRLNLTVKGPKDYDQSNIKQLRAYLINTSMLMYTEPWDPCDCACERHRYHHMPFNPRPHIPVNPAFGEGPLRPNYGHPWHCADHACCHHHCFHRPHVDMQFLNNIYTYQASSKVLAGKNKIQVYFPAHAQIACGNYKLVLVLSVYESGWGRCDLHTYTIDYPDVFTLVDSSAGVSGDVTIDVDTNTIIDGGGESGGCDCDCNCDELRDLVAQLTERIAELEENCHCGGEFSVSPANQTVGWSQAGVPREYTVVSSTNWSVEEI